MQILNRAHLISAFCGLALAMPSAGVALQPANPDEPPMHEPVQPPPPPMGGPDENNRSAPGDQQRPERRRGGQDGNENRRPRMGGPNGQGPQGNAPGEGPMRQPMSNDPKVVRAALDLVRTNLKEMMPRIDKAIAALDNGADVATVRRELAQARAENAQGFIEAIRQSGIFGPGLMGNIRRGPGSGDGPDTQDDRDGPGPRGPEGEMREGREGRGPRAFTQEDRERVLSEIREHNPELAKQIESAREQSPESADQFLRFIGDKMRGMRELRDRDPESYQLRKTEIIGLFKMLKLRKEYAEAVRTNADQAQLDTIKGELRVVMGELWDTRQKLDEMQLRELEKRVERMKNEAKKRAETREKVINERTESVIREATQPPGGKGGRAPMRRDGAGPGPNGQPGPGGPRGGPGENAPPHPTAQPR